MYLFSILGFLLLSNLGIPEIVGVDIEKGLSGLRIEATMHRN